MAMNKILADKIVIGCVEVFNRAQKRREWCTTGRLITVSSRSNVHGEVT